MLQGKINQGSGHHLLELNKLLVKAKHFAHIPLKVHRHLKDIVFVTWSDSAWAVKADGKSQRAYITVAADADIMDGACSKVSVIGWTSYSLKRVASSSATAEMQAANDGQEDLEYTRLASYELSAGPVHLSDPWPQMRTNKGI